MFRYALMVILSALASSPAVYASEAEVGCPEIYLAVDREDMDLFRPFASVSMFALLADPTPYLSREIFVSGMLVHSHGQSPVLVPVGSRHYLYTNDAIRIDGSRVPACFLEKLDGVPVHVQGVVQTTNRGVEKLVIEPLHLLRTIPALTEPASDECCVRHVPGSVRD